MPMVTDKNAQLNHSIMTYAVVHGTYLRALHSCEMSSRQDNVNAGHQQTSRFCSPVHLVVSVYIFQVCKENLQRK